MQRLATPCREWPAKAGRDYGGIAREGKEWLIHRWVWTLMNGPIPDGLVVRHRCDNPPCYRLDHLELGSQADNIRDMMERGRWGGTPRLDYCQRGHEFTDENTYIRPDNGRRQCRKCRAARCSA